jgi:hypothetical protein
MLKTVSLDLGSLRVIAEASKDLKTGTESKKNIARVAHKKSSTSTYVFWSMERQDEENCAEKSQ